ncbi:EF-hand domain pair [Trinorchestia longiramus]|nr:EF-hand domain pair [Trinorchestia longiramus]
MSSSVQAGLPAPAALTAPAAQQFRFCDADENDSLQEAEFAARWDSITVTVPGANGMPLVETYDTPLENSVHKSVRETADSNQNGLVDLQEFTYETFCAFSGRDPKRSH